jgi:hypothetical protein
MKRYTKLFENYDDPGAIKTWTFLISWFMQDNRNILLDGMTIGIRIQALIDAAKRNGVDPKTITPSTDGAGTPTLDLRASTSSFLAILYDLVEEGIIDEDIEDLEEVIPMFLKAERGRGWNPLDDE